MNAFRLFALTIVTAAAPSIALAGTPVQTYTRSVTISRSEGLFTTRSFVPAADVREGRLVEAIPFPANRTDDPNRVENGRLWVPRSPVGSRSVTGELPYGFPGAAGVGAEPGENERVIFVRSETGLPNIAISPFDTIDDSTFDLIEEQIPFIASNRTRTELRRDEVISELREAQSQWLREHGYIQKVRTHVNPSALYGDGESQAMDASNIEPRAIIRIRPADESYNADAGTARDLPTRTIRISSPIDSNSSFVVRVRVLNSERVETAQAEDREPGQSPE